MNEKENSINNTILHYDTLIDEDNDPVHDPKPLQDYMDKWDGQTFIEKMKLNKSKTVLEIGVGTGRLAIKTVPVCGEFFGIDISPKTIKRAAENLKGYNNVHLICGDFLSIDLTEEFDVIYSSLTFMHISEKQQAINKISDLLKIGGKFLLSIDKNQDEFIDAGTTKVRIIPDTPTKIKACLNNTDLFLTEEYETEFANIFIAEKRDKHGV